MTERTLAMIDDLEKVVQMQQHTLLHPESELAKKFIAQKTKAEIAFESKYGMPIGSSEDR